MECAELRGLHRAMVLSRAIETYAASKSGHWYPSIGEEGVIVGAFSTLSDDDVAAPHYRGALIVPWLRGQPLRSVLGCLHYSRTSPTQGRLYGGFAGDVSHGVIPYVTMVLGPTVAMAVGAAMAFKTRGEQRVAVASFGDGTAGTGDFHESLNLACVLHAPVVFVCQNNQFSISTKSNRGLACGSVAEWAASYRMPTHTVDGNDVSAVYQAVTDAVARARTGDGPSFVEALTYRQTGHFIADPASYRDQGEADIWKSKDPITRLERHLTELGTSQTSLDAVRADCQAEVAAAAAAAAAGDHLGADDLGIGESYELTT
jgi:acetoin:2,6-dichlorophenolindophenol oxidoreductase subunit alpha